MDITSCRKQRSGGVSPPCSYSGSPSDTLLRRFFGEQESGDDVVNDAAQILGMLEDSDSALTGMFRSFLRDVNLSMLPLEVDQQHHKRPRPPETELQVYASLEELYVGCAKCVPMSRYIRDHRSGGLRLVKETIPVLLEAGTRQGSRIILPGLGHQDEDGNAADLALIVQQQPHSCYKLLRNDLHLTVSIPLVTALTGGEVAVEQLDGRVLHVHLVEVVSPGFEVVVAGEGMPVQGQPHKRGNMHLHFNVKFPVGLDMEKQQQLRQALEGAL